MQKIRRSKRTNTEFNVIDLVLMESAKKYWIFLIVGLAIFIFVDLVWIMPSVRDIGVNLFTDAIFMIITIVFLSWLIKRRENLSWKPVKNHVLNRIGTQVYFIFTNFANLCVCTHGGGVPMGETMEQFRKRIFFKQLEELNEKVELNKAGRTILAQGMLASSFEMQEQYLDKIEAKYTKYLDPKLVDSLMVIQDKLHRLRLVLDNKKIMTFPVGISDEEYFKGVSGIIHSIVKEIHKSHVLSVIEMYQ